MSTIDFFYRKDGSEYEVHVLLTKNVQHVARDTVQKAIKSAVSGYLSTHGGVSGTIEVKLSDVALPANVREVGKSWEKISIQGGSVGTLTRSMRSKVELDALSTAVTPFGAVLFRIVSFLLGFFHFLTRHQRMPPVDMKLLQEVVGVFPQDGSVTMRQALSYWTKALEHEATPSLETTQLVAQLKACSSISEQIEQLRSCKQPKFDTDFHSLVERVTNDIRAGGRHLIPTGFWRPSAKIPNQIVFQDCLLEVSKTDGGRFKMTLFSMEEGAQSLLTTHEIDEAQLARDIPLILSLHFVPGKETIPDPLQGMGMVPTRLPGMGMIPKWLQGFFSRFLRPKIEIPSQQMMVEELPPVVKSTPELEGLFGGEKGPPSKRVAQYASAVRIAKKFIRHKLAEDHQEYKTIRVRSEIDLLYQAVSTDEWQKSDAFRNTVFHSAHKLLSDIIVEKKKLSPTERYGTTHRTLELERKKLEDILDKVSSYAPTQADKSTREPIDTTSLGAVSRPLTLSPKEVLSGKPITMAGIDVTALSPSERPDTIDKVNVYLGEASLLCERLVKEGRFDLLEDCVPMIYSNLSLYRGAEPFYKGISEAQAHALSTSLAKIQQSLCACNMARNQYSHGNEAKGYGYYFHPYLWLAIPFLEAMHDQIAVELDPTKVPLPYFANTEILDLLRNGFLSYLRSSAVLRCFREVVTYNTHRGAARPFSLALKEGGPQATILQEAQKSAVLGAVFLPGRLQIFMNGMAEEKPEDVLHIEQELEKRHEDHIVPIPRTDEARRAFFSREREFKRNEEGESYRFCGVKKEIFQTLPVLEVRPHTYGGTYPQTLNDYFLSPPGVYVGKVYEGARNEYGQQVVDFRKKDSKYLLISGRMYSPSIPSHVPTDETGPFFDLDHPGITGFDAALCQYAEENGHGSTTLNEFKFFQPGLQLEEGMAPLSRDEVVAIQTLSPKPNAEGGAAAAIANFLKLIQYHPRLLSCSQVKAFIYRTILRPGVMDSSEVCTSMQAGVGEIFTRINDIRDRAHKMSDYGTEIHLISLLGALSVRVPLENRKGIPLACRDWIEELKNLKEVVRQKSLWQQLFHQEYLSLLVAYSDFLSTSHKWDREIGPALASWVKLKTSKGGGVDTDPGVHKEAHMLVLSFLSRMSKMTESERRGVLDYVAAECALPVGTGDMTRFPLCQYGSVTIQLDTGDLWRNGEASSVLPPEVESSTLFAKTKLSKNKLWKVVQGVDAEHNLPVYVFTTDEDSTIRITTSQNGMQFSMQKLISGVWCDVVEPRLEKKPEEGKKPEAATAINDNRTTITLPPALYSLVRNDLLYVQRSPTPMTVFNANGLTFRCSQDGVVKNAQKGAAVYGMQGKTGASVFSAIDERNVCITTTSKREVLFPYLALRDTRGNTKSRGLTARVSGTTWEYDDESLKGYHLQGCQQPMAFTTRLRAGAPPIIPFGIHSYHLLQNGKGQQKVLIPMRPLEPSFPGHVRGMEAESSKQFSRFLTLVQSQELTSPEQESSLLCFDVVDGALNSDDPLANAYLAYMYLTQQRYEDAKRYLEKSHTNLPDPALEQLYKDMLAWPDGSEEGERVKGKVCLLQCDWPLRSPSEREGRMTKGEIVQWVLGPCTRATSEDECLAMVRKLLLTLDQKDRIRFAYAFQSCSGGVSFGGTPEAAMPASPEGALSLEMKTPFAKQFIEHVHLEEEVLPERFLEEIAIHPDETLMKYFLVLIRLGENGGSEPIFEAIHNARVRMSNEVKGLELLLFKFLEEVRAVRSGEDREAIEGLKRGEYKHSLQKVKKIFQSAGGKKESISEYSVERAFNKLYRKATAKPPAKPKEEQPEKKAAIQSVSRKRVQDLLDAVLPPVPESVPKRAEVLGESVPVVVESAFGPKVSFSDCLLPGRGSSVLGEVDQFFDSIDIKDPAQKEKLRKKRDDLRKDTKDYLIEEGGQKLFDVTKVKQVENRFQTLRRDLAKEQKRLRETIFTTVNRIPDSELDRVRAALTPSTEYIHFERLLGSYVQGDLPELLARYSVRNIDVPQLEASLQQFLLTSIALNHIQKVLKKIPSDTPSLSIDDQREIGALLEANRYFAVDGTPRSRLLLMLEYSCGFLLRRGNVELVDKLLRDPNCICQLPPGSGKTLVVLRLIAVMRANGTNLSALILPEWLYEQNRQDLDLGLKQLFGQDIFCLDVPTKRDYSVTELDDILIQLHQTIANKSVLLTTRQSLLTLRDSFKHLEKKLSEQKDDPQAAEIKAIYTRMAKVISLLRDKMEVLPDEVDSILDIHREINRKEEEGDVLPQWQRHCGCLLYSLLLDVMNEPTPLGRIACAIRDNTHVDLPRTLVTTALDAWADKLLDSLQVIKDRERIKKFLLQQPEALVVPDLPQGVKYRELLVAAKSFLSQALPLSTLTKASNTKDGYGRFQSMVIPYAGPDQPDENSEFCNPFEMIAFTIQEYLHKGVGEDQAKILATQIIEQLNAEWLKKGGGFSKSGLDAGKQALEDFGIDVERLQRYDDETVAAQYVQQCINGNLRYRLNYCRRYILPNIKTTREQQRSDAFDLVEMAASCGGMTATPHNVHTYHDRISKEGATTRTSDGKTIAAVLKHGIKVHCIPAKKAVSEYLLESGSSDAYQGIIDIGAYCKDRSPAAFAVEMAGRLPENSATQYVVYINREGKIVAYDRKSKEVKDFDEQSMPLETRKTVYQIFIGADIKQTPRAKFLVTIGNLNFLKDFIQGVMRLRELNQEQSFDIALSADVVATIREVTGKMDGELLLADIVAYCMDNELKATQSDTLAAEKRKIERVPAASVFNATVKIAATLDPNRSADRNAVIEIHNALHSLVSVEPNFSVENLSGVHREEDTFVTLEALKSKTIKKLEDLLLLEVVRKYGVLHEELTVALNGLRKRKFTDPQFLPPKNMVRPGCEEIGQTAIAFQEQVVQAQTQTQAVAFERRVMAPAAEVPSWVSLFYGVLRNLTADPLRMMPSLNRQEGCSIFDDSVRISENILRGWKSGYYKDLAYVVYIPRGLARGYYGEQDSRNTVCVLDKSDFREFLHNRYNGVYCVIGPEISFVKMEQAFPSRGYSPFISNEWEQRDFYKTAIQIKLTAGFIDFTSTEERKALEAFVRKTGKERIRAFIEWNRDHYLSEANYARFQHGEGFLAEVLREV